MIGVTVGCPIRNTCLPTQPRCISGQGFIVFTVAPSTEVSIRLSEWVKDKRLQAGIADLEILDDNETSASKANHLLARTPTVRMNGDRLAHPKWKADHIAPRITIALVIT